jgi:hypothetical protein
MAVTACDRMRLDRFPRPDAFASEKGVTHYWRDLKGGGADAYRAMLAIWLSKIALTSDVARDHESMSVAWVDASVARFNLRRTNWNFTQDQGHPAKISHFASPMRFFGRPLPLNASYLEGRSSVWTELERLFNAMLEKALQMPYGHDEETVLAQCLSASPDLFRCIGAPQELLGGKGNKKSRRAWWRGLTGR